MGVASCMQVSAKRISQGTRPRWYNGSTPFVKKVDPMAKVFRPSSREASILSKIESSKEHARRSAIHGVRDHAETLGNAIAMKLVENHLVETTSKNSLEEQIVNCLETLCRADDFEIDYQIAPLRNLVQHPNVVSLYLTAFVIEKLINHKSVVDIFGSDADIYMCINQQVAKTLP
jgi:hypothetical protein